ncbi:hypothetical protein V8G54_017630, partial [Vigna mungo]
EKNLSWKLGLIERKIIKVRRDLETSGGRTKNKKQENYTAYESFNLYEADTHWTSWLVTMFGVANIVVSIICMYINNCLKITSVLMVAAWLSSLEGSLSNLCRRTRCKRTRCLVFLLQH